MNAPSDETFVTGGTVHHGSRFYVAREVEEEVFDALRAKRYVTLVGSRQIGKTSLLQKIQAVVEPSYDWASALIDLSTINDPAANLKSWAGQFCRRLVDQLRVFLDAEPDPPVPATTPELLEYWTSLAQRIEKPRLLILLDEASSVPPKVRDLFYSTIRSMDSARTMARPDPHLSRYGFAFAGVFEPERLVRDRVNSPFNVSRIFHLPDFHEREVEALVAALPLPAESARPTALAEAVHGWTGGHPYLTQWLAELVTRHGAVPAADLQRIVDAEAARLTDVARDNLDPMVAVSFEADADRELLRRILAGERVTFSRANRSVARLELSGALRRAGDVCSVRNRVYEGALQRALGPAAPGSSRRVFLSYSSEDSDFVDRLAGDLERAGLGIWVDRRRLGVGDSIIEGVARGLAESTDVVAVLSRASLESRWVRTELSAALMHELDGTGIRVLPVLLDDVSLPFLMSHIVHADFRQDYRQGLRELLDALGTPREGAAPPEIARSRPAATGPALAPNGPELRRLLTRNLNESEVGALWYDTLGERMPETTPPSKLPDLVIRLLDEARARGRIDELLRNLRAERPDLV